MRSRQAAHRHLRSSPYSVDYVQTANVSEGRHGREMGGQIKLLTNVVSINYSSSHSLDIRIAGWISGACASAATRRL